MPGSGQTGCTYTGKTGGPIRTETLTAICVRDGPGNASNPTASKSENMKRAIRMILTFLAFAGRCQVFRSEAEGHLDRTLGQIFCWQGSGQIPAKLLTLEL